MRMVGKKIMVKPYQTKAETEGGIALPQSSVHDLPYGEVVDYGPEVTDIKKGTVVMFSGIGPIPIELKGESYVLIEPEDILGIMEKGDY